MKLDLSTLPRPVLAAIQSWGTLSCSPFSEAMYDTTQKGWGVDPPNHRRAAAHWNWRDDSGHVHAKTDVAIPYGYWAVGRWIAEEDRYHVEVLAPPAGAVPYITKYGSIDAATEALADQAIADFIALPARLRNRAKKPTRRTLAKYTSSPLVSLAWYDLQNYATADNAEEAESAKRRIVRSMYWVFSMDDE